MAHRDPALVKTVHEETKENFYITAIINSAGALYVTVDEVKSLNNIVKVWEGNNIISARIFIEAKIEEAKRFDRFVAKLVIEGKNAS